MTGPEPYDIDLTNRLEVNRLRTAAKRGDQRAQATLDLAEQQKHTAKWEATEQARADHAAARAEHEKNRPISVGGAMDKIKREREQKEAQRTARNDAIKVAESKRRDPGGW